MDLMVEQRRYLSWVMVVACLNTMVFGATDTNDLRILNDFRKGLENPELLKWPSDGDDPCGPPLWPHVFCSGNRVTEIQVQNLGLKGTLPQDLNQLSKLSNLGLQRNQFSGKLPSFSGLSELEFAYLDYNNFDTIPFDFFDGLSSIRVLALDYNPLNMTTGWTLPDELGKFVQLTNLSLMNSSLVGPLPEFVGSLQSLTALKLSYNKLSGPLPSSFSQSVLHILWLNDQFEEGISGPIDVIASMPSLTQVWLHGNQFNGAIPDGIGALTSLKELRLNRNKLVGPVPQSLASLELDILDLSSNLLMGPIPSFKARNVSYGFNSFCLAVPGKCSHEVDALVDFLGGLNYPPNLVSDWSGDDPCKEPWLGLSCSSASQLNIINLPNRRLNGTLNPSVANIDSLLEIRLQGNNIRGKVPSSFTQLKSLRLLDLTDNNIEPPLPQFRPTVKVLVSGNPLFNHHKESPAPVSSRPPIPIIDPSVVVGHPSKAPVPGPTPGSPLMGAFQAPLSSSNHTSNISNVGTIKEGKSNNKTKVIAIGGAIAASTAIGFLVLILVLTFYHKKRRNSIETPGLVVIHPRDPSGPDNMLKIAVLEDLLGPTQMSLMSGNGGTTMSSGLSESGNLVVSVQLLRKVTNNFATENELGRGGFGVVYKGELDDGTKIAVKRMEAGFICGKACNEFHAEITVLSKVRHRHLVNLYGYSIEGNERLLVYEYMPQGALSRHLFHWRSLNLKPLPWKSRLSIALDVAKGVEYLHSLAKQSFIHRDLKSSNILLDNEFRAKVSDFGLVKLAPGGEQSVATKLAGTFGYLAPEYAVTGKVSTKVDVFSYGVVLMELLTGLTALDEERSEESRYLAEWFWRMKSENENLNGAVDLALELKEEALDSIRVVAELAGHCTARDPSHRPDMSHVVNVLGPLVDQWKPINESEEREVQSLDFTMPLTAMLKEWKMEVEGDNKGYNSSTSLELDDSRGSIPIKPTGFGDSLHSMDGR